MGPVRPPARSPASGQSSRRVRTRRDAPYSGGKKGRAFIDAVGIRENGPPVPSVSLESIRAAQDPAQDTKTAPRRSTRGQVADLSEEEESEDDLWESLMAEPATNSLAKRCGEIQMILTVVLINDRPTFMFYSSMLLYSCRLSEIRSK